MADFGYPGRDSGPEDDDDSLRLPERGRTLLERHYGPDIARAAHTVFRDGHSPDSIQTLIAALAAGGFYDEATNLAREALPIPPWAVGPQDTEVIMLHVERQEALSRAARAPLPKTDSWRGRIPAVVSAGDYLDRWIPGAARVSELHGYSLKLAAPKTVSIPLSGMPKEVSDYLGSSSVEVAVQLLTSGYGEPVSIKELNGLRQVLSSIATFALDKESSRERLEPSPNSRGSSAELVRGILANAGAIGDLSTISGVLHAVVRSCRTAAKQSAEAHQIVVSVLEGVVASWGRELHGGAIGSLSDAVMQALGSPGSPLALSHEPADFELVRRTLKSAATALGPSFSKEALGRATEAANSLVTHTSVLLPSDPEARAELLGWINKLSEAFFGGFSIKRLEEVLRHWEDFSEERAERIKADLPKSFEMVGHLFIRRFISLPAGAPRSDFGAVFCAAIQDLGPWASCKQIEEVAGASNEFSRAFSRRDIGIEHVFRYVVRQLGPLATKESLLAHGAELARVAHVMPQLRQDATTFHALQISGVLCAYHELEERVTPEAVREVANAAIKLAQRAFCAKRGAENSPTTRPEGAGVIDPHSGPWGNPDPYPELIENPFGLLWHDLGLDCLFQPLLHYCPEKATEEVLSAVSDETLRFIREGRLQDRERRLLFRSGMGRVLRQLKDKVTPKGFLEAQRLGLEFANS